MIEKITLNDLKDFTEEYISNKLQKNINIHIHYTTKLDIVKANIQGANLNYDIVISGKLRIKSIIEGIAHEAAHILYQNHSEKWKKEKEEIKKFLTEKIKEKGGKNEEKDGKLKNIKNGNEFLVRVIISNGFSFSMLSGSKEVLISCHKISTEEVKELLKEHPFLSIIGHQATAEILSNLLEVPIKTNRVFYKFQENDILIVASLNTRLQEGKILSKEELRETDISFWKVEIKKGRKNENNT